MITKIILAFIAALITFGFTLIVGKLNEMEVESKKRHEEHKKVSIKERELLLALADTTKLTAKKVNDAHSVNGELEESIDYLQEKKHAVQDITREIAFDHLEN